MIEDLACIFSAKDRIITCNNGMVTCDTMPQFEGINYRFDMFGIQLVDKNSVFLFPKNFTDNSFSDSKTMIDNKGRLIPTIDIINKINESLSLIRRLRNSLHSSNPLVMTREISNENDIFH